MTIKSKVFYILSSLTLLNAGCTDDFMQPDNIDGNLVAFASHLDGASSSGSTRSGNDSPRSIYDGKIEVESKDLGQIYVHTIVNENSSFTAGMLTRADATADKSELGDFYVSAYADNREDVFAYPDGENGTGANPDFMVKDVVKKQGNVYKPERNRYWPNSDMYIRFFAFYSPKEDDVKNHTLLHYEHTVSNDVEDQNDVMVAVSGPVSSSEYRKSKESVPLQFHHILTKVRFKIVDDVNNALNGYKISSITYNNLTTNGTFYLREFSGVSWKEYNWETYKSLREDFQNEMWVKPGEKNSIQLTKTSTGTSNEVDFNDEPMMMIPQNLDGVSVSLVLTKDGSEIQEYEIKLDGRKWIMGDDVEYALSSSGTFTEEIFEIRWKNGEEFTSESDDNHEWGILSNDGSRNFVWHAPFYDINYYDNSEVDMTDQFQIISYRRTVTKNGKDGKEEVVETPLNWDMTGHPDTGKDTYGSGNGEWLKEKGAKEGSDVNAITEFTLKVANQTLKKIDPRESLYKNKTPGDFLPAGALDSDGYWDLSKKFVDAEGNPVMNTSNCYIINAPGKYKLPVVYGNSISHGKINCYSFKDQRNGENILNTFYEADKEEKIKEIDGPVIKGLYAPSFIWTDSRNMKISVESILEYVSKTFKHLDGTEEDLSVPYIKFTVSDIEQGNFCIGFESGTGGIRWSWHLWVTPYSSDESKILDGNLDEEDRMQRAVNVTDKSGDSYELLPYNIGWCDRMKIHFGDGDFGNPDPRVYINTYKQDKTGKVITLTISQKQADDIQYGNNSLYQWGRMAPLRGSYIFQTAKPILKNFYKLKNGKYEAMEFGRPTGLKTIPYVLAFPSNVFIGDQITDWSDKRYDNLWTIEREIVIGTDENGNKKTDTRYYKTIYDPSPVGYMVPPANVFDNMASSTEWSETPIWGMKVNVDGKDVYFPVTGYRETDSDATLTGAGQRAFYLTSSIVEANGYGYVDGINIGRIRGENGEYSNTIDPKAIISRVISGAVRPIREPGYDFLNVDHFVPDNDITVDMQ